MAELTPTKCRARAAAWLRTHPFTALGGAVLLALAFQFCLRRDSEWDQVYLPAAAKLWNGGDLYRMGDAYLYPPFMAATALPFLALSAPLSRLLWFAVNALCLLALLRWSWRLAGGGQLQGNPSRNARERIAAVLGCICAISYLQNCLAHQQTDIVIGAILAAGCLLLVRGRPLTAASAFGIAAACKCTALLWSPYLLWRGRPLAALWVFVVAVSLNLLPDLVHPSPRGGSWLQDYVSRFLTPLTASDHYVGTWGSDAVYNQSLTGLGQRWCTTRWTWMPTDCTVEPRAPLLSPQTLRFGMYAIELGLLAAVLWICRPPFQKPRGDAASVRQALECGMVLLLMVLLSPMSSKAHFGTLVIPAFCLARAALQSRGWLLKGALAATVVLGLLCNKDPLGERLYTLSLWYGLVTWQTLLLLGGCLLLYRSTLSAHDDERERNGNLTPSSDHKYEYRATA
ncbi:MAG: glycosyltransferase family 87 protein [Gemmataceae bacterium]